VGTASKGRRDNSSAEHAEKSQRIVTLVHQSAKDFLSEHDAGAGPLDVLYSGRFGIDEIEGHYAATKSCIDYLHAPTVNWKLDHCRPPSTHNRRFDLVHSE
jgi:hypothetical protein